MTTSGNQNENTPVPKEGIEELLASVRADVEAIRAFKPEFEEIKAALHEARGSADADIAAISECKARFETLRDEAHAKSEEVANAQQAIQTELATVRDQLGEIKNQASTTRQSVDADVNHIAECKGRFESLRNETDSQAQELNKAQAALQGTVDKFKTQYQSLEKLYLALVEDTKDSNGTITTPSITSQINEVLNNAKAELSGIRESHASINTDATALKNSLEREIRSLLPGAGAAGLSSAYFEAKERYGSVPCEPAGGETHWFPAVAEKIVHFIRNNSGTAFYYALFISPLVVIFKMFEHLQIATVNDTILLYKFIITVPLAIISWFGLSSIRLNRRLYEEYNHKQRVMQLFHSFKEEVGTQGTPEQKQELLSIMLEVVKDKPSLIMPRYDKGFGEMFSRLCGKPARMASSSET